MMAVMTFTGAVALAAITRTASAVRRRQNTEEAKRVAALIKRRGARAIAGMEKADQAIIAEVGRKAWDVVERAQRRGTARTAAPTVVDIDSGRKAGER